MPSPTLTSAGLTQLPASAANASGAAAGTVPVATGNGTYVNTTAKSIDTTDAPLALSTTPGPGTGSNGASASDHSHPMPLSSQLADVTSGSTLAQGQAWVMGSSGLLVPGSVGGAAPLWQAANNAEFILPRGHLDDSGSYGDTPASGVVLLAYFRAMASRTIGHIGILQGGTNSSGLTLARVGLYSVNASTYALTLLAQSASFTSLGSNNTALTATTSITAGSIYAVGIIQVGTTPGSLLGGAYDNEEYFYGSVQPRMSATLTAQTDLPASITDASLGNAKGFIPQFIVAT